MSKNRCLTVQEESAFRRFFKTRGDWQAVRDWAWMRALLTTGMRISEFSTLTAGEAMTAFRLGYLFVPAIRRKAEACDLTVHLTGEAAQAFVQDLDRLCGRNPLEAQGVNSDTNAGKCKQGKDGSPNVLQRQCEFILRLIFFRL